MVGREKTQRTRIQRALSSMTQVHRLPLFDRAQNPRRRVTTLHATYYDASLSVTRAHREARDATGEANKAGGRVDGSGKRVDAQKPRGNAKDKTIRTSSHEASLWFDTGGNVQRTQIEYRIRSSPHSKCERTLYGFLGTDHAMESNASVTYSWVVTLCPRTRITPRSRGSIVNRYHRTCSVAINII